jgi:diguanylate cyclase (GGDEF)-like protein
MIVTDGKDLVEANKALLSLLEYETFEALKREHSCVCDFFEEGETDEYLLPMMDDQTWIEYILAFPNREHKVKIIVGGTMMLFKIDTSVLETAQLIRYIVIFTDISSIMTQSNTDALTGIANRTHFNLIYEHALHTTQREHEELSIIFFDIDYFKNVNDSFGHLVGDDVLRHMANLVKNTLRKSDMLARWGGEEFIILLLNTPLNSAVSVAEALRELVEKEPFEIAGHITCSFGVSALRSNEQGSELLQRVDALLYQAKNSGRNRVVIG